MIGDIGNLPTLAVFRGARPVPYGVAMPPAAAARTLAALAGDERAPVAVPQPIAAPPQVLGR